MSNRYWRRRCNLGYYRKTLEYAKKHCQQGRTLLDVGGGIGLGCRYLEWYPDFERTSVETPTLGCTMPGVSVVHADFMEWSPSGRFDLVLCLQVIEHVRNPTEFAQKLFACGGTVIISVPFRWNRGRCKSHLHDPIDEKKLLAWTGRAPAEMSVVDERLVAAYPTIKSDATIGKSAASHVPDIGLPSIHS